MKLNIRQAIIGVSVLFIVGVTVLACTSPNVSAAIPSATTDVTPTQDVIKATSLTVNPPEVNTGVDILITASVTNTGDKPE
ncbi:MAG: hypothetical protein PHR56_07095, partial [Dehalococcoidales bacterium]|nr:hypothetical protein [Dehalococcoidales bacterium]